MYVFFNWGKMENNETGDDNLNDLLKFQVTFHHIQTLKFDLKKYHNYHSKFYLAFP